MFIFYMVDYPPRAGPTALLLFLHNCIQRPVTLTVYHLPPYPLILLYIVLLTLAAACLSLHV